MATLQHRDSLFVLALAAKIGSIEDPRARLKAMARVRGLKYTEISLRSKIPYTKLEPILNGRRGGSPEELAAIADVLYATEGAP